MQNHQGVPIDGIYDNATSACAQNIAVKKEKSRIRELRPFDPKLSTAHLESEPIRVIIDYVDSPPDAVTPLTPTEMKCFSEDEEIQKELLLSSPRQSHAFSISSISSVEDETTCRSCNHQIFTVESERLAFIANSKDHKNPKNDNYGRSCHCSKPSFKNLCENPEEQTRDKTTLTTLCETPIREYFKYTNKNQIIDNKSDPSHGQNHNAKSKSGDKETETKCSWTCGTKMFSKSEKVIETY